MSRPRKPYGPNPPGRLFGTMIKVLAAEISDQGRLSRGKQYWAEDAVIDIVVGHGAVTAEIQGSRPQPYVVTLEAASGTGVPGKRDLWVQCTCPDDAGTGTDACKHAVATLFALSDEVTIEPELVERWRASRRQPRPHHSADPHPADPHHSADVASLPGPAAPLDGVDTAVDDDRPDAEIIELRPRPDPVNDKISVLLQAPAGAASPTFPELEPLDHRDLRDRLLDAVLGDALDELGIRWE